MTIDVGPSKLISSVPADMGLRVPPTLVDDFGFMQVWQILETVLRESALQNHSWNMLIRLPTFVYHL